MLEVGVGVRSYMRRCVGGDLVYLIAWVISLEQIRQGATELPLAGIRSFSGRRRVVAEPSDREPVALVIEALDVCRQLAE